MIVANGIYSDSLNAVRTLLKSDILSGVQLEELKDMLEAGRPSASAYKLACQTEYEVLSFGVDAYHSCDPDFFNAMEQEVPTGFEIIGTKLILHPNEVKRMAGEVFSERIEQIESFYKDVIFPMADAIKLERDHGWSLSRRGNTILVGALGETSFLTHYYIEAEYDATQILIALHRYKKDHAGFPESLKALVPQYMAAVPNDPFDDEAMRYHIAEGLIYSVGEDVIDSGGSLEMRFGVNRIGRRYAKDFVFSMESEIVFVDSDE